MYGRQPRQLLIVWGVSLLLVLLIHWLETQAPALHELVMPFYWIILAVAFYLTWRWLRLRSQKDRRGRIAGTPIVATRKNHPILIVDVRYEAP